MLDDRPDSQYMVVTATNIRIYCFLVDLPVGHFNHNLPRPVVHRKYIEDVYPPSQDNLCLLRCIVKAMMMRPEECLADREKRVKLMWFIFKASQIKKVKSDSVILDHRQGLLEDDHDYLYNEVLDYTDLLREHPPTHKWGRDEVQASLKTMTGVRIEEVQEVENLFDLHIDIFTLKDIEQKGKHQKTASTEVRLSDRPSDRTVNLLICLYEDMTCPITCW